MKTEEDLFEELREKILKDERFEVEVPTDVGPFHHDLAIVCLEEDSDLDVEFHRLAEITAWPEASSEFDYTLTKSDQTGRAVLLITM